MTKKLLAIFLAISIVLSFSACKGEQDNSDSSTAEETTTLSETTAEMKTIEPPADGWTPELLNQVMYLNGKPFSLPCTLKDLGEGYSFSKDVSDNNDGTGSCDLLYNNEKVSYIFFNNYSQSKGATNDSIITVMSFDRRTLIIDFKNGFDVKKCSINGIFLGSTKEEVNRQMGDANLNIWGDALYGYYYNDKERELVTLLFGIEGTNSLDKIVIADF